VGAGTGSYLRSVLEEFSDAEGIWIDASEAMRERAETALADLGDRVTFHLGDLRDADTLPLAGDVVLSSRAVHHFRPETIERLYRAVADGLRPGGSFANLDHFAPPDDWRGRYEAIRPSFVGTGDGGGEPHSHDAPPQPIEDHLAWLRRAGFADPDVPWRFLWTALVVARRPS
jgi:tRNA (cmo5U34)-methyltransferase